MFRSTPRLLSRLSRLNIDIEIRSRFFHQLAWELPAGRNRFSVLNLGTRNMSSSSSTTDADPDDENVIKEASVPNEGWTEKTLKFYNELSELCESGEWEKIKSFYHYGNEGRLFVRALEMPGKQFEYASFLNREEKCIRTVVQFGPWLQGPKGAVHGGAIATIFDSVIGVLLYNSGYRCATLNLNVDYHGFLPLYTTAECKAWITKIDGRKIHTAAELKSADGKYVFDRCTSLWYAMGSTDEEIIKEQVKAIKSNSKC